MDCSLQGSSVHGILHTRNWSGLPFTPPGYLPHPENKLVPITSPALAGKFITTIADKLILKKKNHVEKQTHVRIVKNTLERKGKEEGLAQL